MNPTSIFRKAVWSGVGKNDSKNRNKTFFFFLKKASFQKKKWPQKIGSHGNINVEVHATMTLKCSQINFAKFGGLT